MKQLGSRWAVAALLAPVLIILSILLTGIERPQAATGGKGKGSVQLSFTGSVSATSGLAFQSLLLNVISVRLNQSSDLSVSENDPNWQTISAPAGATTGESVATLTAGGDFGPNGNSVTVGQAQSEIQIDLAQLQNTIVQFNTGSVKAIPYGQIELLLDSKTPGVVVPQCGLGVSTGEGCIVYPLQFPTGFTSIRVATPFTVTRNTPQSLVLDISVVLGGGPSSSTSAVAFAPLICAVPASGPSSCPAPPFTATTQAQISAVITDTVSGNPTKKTMVSAEQSGSSTIAATAQVFKVGSVWQYTMILPAPAPGAGASPALYDFFTSTSDRSQDPHAAVPVFAGIYSSPLPSPDPFHFNIAKKATRPVSGFVSDACTALGIPGATLQLYVPASMVGTEDCTASDAPAPCTTTCGQFVNNPNTNDVEPGCVIVGVTSTDDTGSYPLPGNGTQVSPLKVIPIPTGTEEYALTATASGYNGEALGLGKAKSNTLICPGSGYKKANGLTPCNFSLQHGEIDVTTDIGPSGIPPTFRLNVLVNAEDHGTFTGEGLAAVTIPAGQPSNSVAVPLLVPINAPTLDAAATVTPTPVNFGGAASYDLFASVQDLFGSAPQKVSGHQIAVLGDVPAPTACQPGAAPIPESVTLEGLACVGHGSIAGTVASPDANTQVVVSKLDPNDNNVAIMSNQVPLVTTNPNFAICAPADSYIVTHYEATPGGTPIAGASTAVSLATPIILNSPPVTTTPTPVPCLGICSDFSQSSSGKSCYLCQTSGVIPNPF